MSTALAPCTSVLVTATTQGATPNGGYPQWSAPFVQVGLQSPVDSSGNVTVRIANAGSTTVYLPAGFDIYSITGASGEAPYQGPGCCPAGQIWDGTACVAPIPIGPSSGSAAPVKTTAPLAAPASNTKTYLVVGGAVVGVGLLAWVFWPKS
jgi:hypothetical protein